MNENLIFKRKNWQSDMFTVQSNMVKQNKKILSQQTFNNLSPLKFRWEEFFCNFHTMDSDWLWKADVQQHLLQSCIDNPDVFGRDIDTCIKSLTKYLVFPREYEYILTQTICEANKKNAKTYKPIKDASTGDMHLVHQFDHNTYIKNLRDALKQQNVLYQFGSFLIGMLLSWKTSYDSAMRMSHGVLSADARDKLLQRQRKNIFIYYQRYIKSKIAEGWEAWEAASEFIQKPITTRILPEISRGIAHTLDIPHVDYWNALIVTSQLPKKTWKRKYFDPRKMPSLFQRTGDLFLDNLLDDWREYIEKPSSAWYTIKPHQILLRKFSPKDGYERPHQYEFQVYSPSYLKDYFDWEKNS